MFTDRHLIFKGTDTENKSVVETVPVCAEQSWGRHAFGQSDGTIITPVQLLHDEAEVRLQERRRRKPPEQRRRVHQHRHQQQDVGEELDRRYNEMQIQLNHSPQKQQSSCLYVYICSQVVCFPRTGFDSTYFKF